MALDALFENAWDLGAFQSGAVELEPEGSAQTIIGLVGDDGLPYRRGGAAYKANAAFGSTGLLSVASTVLPVGQRTLFQSADGRLGALSSDDATPVALTSTVAGAAPRRAVVVGDALVLPDVVTDVTSNGGVYIYGGSYKSATYATGTVTVTNGGNTVTGVGTSWVANADAGMVLVTASAEYGIVSVVNSNTGLTLTREWNGGTAAGQAYVLYPAYNLLGLTPGAPPSLTVPQLEVNRTGPIAAVANRLAYVSYIGQSRVYFTSPFYLSDGDGTDYHSFPTTVVGLASLRDALMVFTQAGIYTISNMAYDLTDPAGNLQQRVDLVNADLIAWGHEGIAPWKGSLVVPALDGVWLLDSVTSPVRISDRISDLYLSYVRTSGYKTGVAEVFNGHYFLPILNSSNAWVDTLVCRLEQTHNGGNFSWTQLSGTGARVTAYAERSSSPPVLLAAPAVSTLNVSDDFSTNTIANYSFDTGGGTLSVSGGQLVPSTTATKRLYRSVGGYDSAGSFYDFEATVKYTTGTVSSGDVRLGKRIDASNRIVAIVFNGGLLIRSIDAGVESGNLGTTAAPAEATSTAYWLRVRIVGNVFTAEHWTSAPTVSGTPAASATYTMAGATATKYGAGVAGQVILALTTITDTNWRLDDFAISEPSLVLNCTSYFSPAAAVKKDQEGSTHPFQLVTRNIPTGGNVKNAVKHLKVKYLLTADGADAPTMTMEANPDGAGWTTLALGGGSPTAGTNDGYQEKYWIVNKAARFIRFRLTLASAAAVQVQSKSIQVFLLKSGRY